MRLAAEFENYKKRMERERSRLLKYAGENMRDLLTTVDNIDRAVEQGNAAADDDSRKLAAMLEGLALTRKGLMATMERYGVGRLRPWASRSTRTNTTPWSWNPATRCRPTTCSRSSPGATGSRTGCCGTPGWWFRSGPAPGTPERSAGRPENGKVLQVCQPNS